MIFTPRLEAPDRDNKFYIPDEKGGLNPCIPRGDGNFCLPNCVGYGFGRAMEICNKYLPLPTNNAEDWYDTAKKKFKTGSTPKLGAIACWRQGKNYNGNDGCGHIAVVEKIYSDGKILTSNSNYYGDEFYLKEYKAPYKISGFEFLGFIYLPYEFETYTKGDYIVNTAVLNVREKPTTSSSRKMFNELTSNAQKQVLSLCGSKCNGYCRGVEFTVYEVNGEWGKTPSGWVCLDYCKKL